MFDEMEKKAFGTVRFINVEQRDTYTYIHKYILCGNPLLTCIYTPTIIITPYPVYTYIGTTCPRIHTDWFNNIKER